MLEAVFDVLQSGMRWLQRRLALLIFPRQHALCVGPKLALDLHSYSVSVVCALIVCHHPETVTIGFHASVTIPSVSAGSDCENQQDARFMKAVGYRRRDAFGVTFKTL